MAKFRCTVTRDTTESTTVEVEATTVEEANIKAHTEVNRAPWEFEFTPDDCCSTQCYIPDPYYAEIIED